MTIYARSDYKIAKLIKHTCDVSLRDGMQCLYNNSWQIADLLFIARKLNHISLILNELVGESLTVEAVGGDTFNAAIRLKGEDPFENMRQLKLAMPNCRIRSLIRGRQLLGFSPVSDEIITKAVQESAENGVDLFRVFDMLNQIDNMTPSIKAILAYRNQQLDKGIPCDKALALEICICYISEPPGVKVVSIDNYLNMAKQFLTTAQQYTRQGDKAVNLVIKDYAGLLTSDVAKPLVEGLKNTIQDMYKSKMLSYCPHITMHLHGDKASLLKEVLTFGASYVDTAIGRLSGTFSHTNIFDYLALGGMSLADAQASVLVHELKEIEYVVNLLSKQYGTYRTPAIPMQKIYDSRLAGGAVASVRNTLKMQKRNLAIFWKKNGISQEHFLNEQDQFEVVLSLVSEIWNRSGRINTVTPGSRIFSDMAILSLMHSRKVTLQGEIIQEIFPPYPFICPSYKKLIMGRFGDTRHAVDAIGDAYVLLLRDAFLLEDTLKTMSTIPLSLEEKQHLSLHTLFDDLKHVDFVHLAQQGALNLLAKRFAKLMTPNIKICESHLKIGKLQGFTPLLSRFQQKANELYKAGIIKEEQINRATLLEAMADPTQPNQIKQMYQYQKTSIPPEGSTILDKLQYIAQLNVNIDECTSLGQLAQHASISEKDMAAVKETLQDAGFCDDLNGTGMGLKDGLQSFHRLVNRTKK